VVDSAIRCGDLDAESFAKAAARVRGKGAARVRRVAEHASGLAANAFESALRGIALEAGLDARPQVPITTGGVEIHPDVVDVERRVVLEADSWEFHATKDAFQRDCWRYTSLTADGWLVLRFTWWQVMDQPDWVREVLERIVARTALGANAA
jgi:very-short-patch-repair endonuclease